MVCCPFGDNSVHKVFGQGFNCTCLLIEGFDVFYRRRGENTVGRILAEGQKLALERASDCVIQGTVPRLGLRALHQSSTKEKQKKPQIPLIEHAIRGAMYQPRFACSPAIHGLSVVSPQTDSGKRVLPSIAPRNVSCYRPNLLLFASARKT